MTKDEMHLYEKKVIEAIDNGSALTLSCGFLRYEALRKLSPNEFTMLHQKNIDGNDDGSKVTFDELVDELVVKGITE